MRTASDAHQELPSQNDLFRLGFADEQGVGLLRRSPGHLLIAGELLITRDLAAADTSGADTILPRALTWQIRTWTGWWFLSEIRYMRRTRFN